MFIEILLGLLRCCIITALIPVIFVVIILPFFSAFFLPTIRSIHILPQFPTTTNDGLWKCVDERSGKIGVWHILPSSLSLHYRKNGIQPSDEEMAEQLARDDNRVILYAHGNSFDRTMEHRVHLYNVLAKLDFHIIAFDYRGYGDSEGSPTEEGIVSDTRTMYEYVKAQVGQKTIFVWGHSMGTGVSTKVVMDLSMEGSPPRGLILESPFNNLHDAIVNHPLFIIFCWMNEFFVQNFLMKPLNRVGLHMETDARIANVTCPILILHAQDDETLPVKLGRRLRDSALTANRTVDYVEFEASRRFGHKYIHKAKELPEVVRSFIRKCDVMAS
ncbi:unnamed protein product [Caenorhabditis auriculariae]|uniref:Serine aminopeptidase S33 domain-containing protein n=1 Tax=Caenorhabditis auriculariae TaxID=2777116 RepID=A0A8S1H4F4_9PELO|nr:unnamed protein product [Caenorhabditis auriculariae]